MASPSTASAGSASDARACNASRPVAAPPPATITCARHGKSPSLGARSASSAGSVTSTRAALSASMAAQSAAPSRVFSGTATAPIRRAPKNTAVHPRPSGSSSATRCPLSTPRPRSALPVRQASARSSPYVVGPSAVTTAGRAPPPAATWSSRKAGTAEERQPPDRADDQQRRVEDDEGQVDATAVAGGEEHEQPERERERHRQRDGAKPRQRFHRSAFQSKSFQNWNSMRSTTPVNFSRLSSHAAHSSLTERNCAM